MTDEQRQRLREAHLRPGVQKRQSEAAKARWADPERRELLIASMNTKQGHKRRQKASKARWADPEYHQSQRQAIKEGWANPEVRERMSKAITRRWANPENKRRMRETLKQKLADPKIRKRMSKACKLSWTSTRRKNMSERTKRMWMERNAILRAGRAVKKLGRPAEDETGARLAELCKAELDWDVIKAQVDRETGTYRTVNAYQHLLKRYRERQGTK